MENFLAGMAQQHPSLGIACMAATSQTMGLRDSGIVLPWYADIYMLSPLCFLAHGALLSVTLGMLAEETALLQQQAVTRGFICLVHSLWPVVIRKGCRQQLAASSLALPSCSLVAFACRWAQEKPLLSLSHLRYSYSSLPIPP